MNQWRKDIASWKCGKTLYLSVPFTWLLPRAEQLAGAHHALPIIITVTKPATYSRARNESGHHRVRGPCC